MAKNISNTFYILHSILFEKTIFEEIKLVREDEIRIRLTVLC